MTKKWNLLIWGLVGILVIAIAAALFVFRGQQELAAKVNGVEITKDKLYDAMYAQVGEYTLEQLITEELIRQEAEKKNVSVTDEEVKQKLESIKEGFPEGQFELILAQQGMTEEQLKEQLKPEVLLEKILAPEIEITDEDIEAYFNENKESFNTPEKVRASHILVGTEEEAKEILAQLQSGADFAELAKEHSTDTASKEKGGDLDYFTRGEMTAEFEKTAFSLPVGQISDVVKTDYGYHIIKVTDKQPAKEATLEESREKVREQLFNEKISARMSEWLTEAKEKADIKKF